MGSLEMTTLWIIANNLALLRSLEFAFQGDYQILTFSDPGACLLALQDGKTGKPDIILTDLEMEGMTGLEMLEEILPENPQIRAYLIATSLTRGIMDKAAELGVKGWIGKPFELEELRGMIKNNSEKKRNTKDTKGKGREGLSFLPQRHRGHRGRQSTKLGMAKHILDPGSVSGVTI
jgi:two-component system response regulator (stage 0 sporulation protein F)